jgi:hypothetical protein
VETGKWSVVRPVAAGHSLFLGGESHFLLLFFFSRRFVGLFCSSRTTKAEKSTGGAESSLVSRPVCGHQSGGCAPPPFSLHSLLFADFAAKPCGLRRMLLPHPGFSLHMFFFFCPSFLTRFLLFYYLFADFIFHSSLSFSRFFTAIFHFSFFP